jgi:hypothetical protein
LRADVAQLVEQLIRNQQVSGSIPLVGSIAILFPTKILQVFPFVVPLQNLVPLIHCFFPSIACGQKSCVRIIAKEAEV